MTNCKRCGRHLTNPDSIKREYGEVCYNKRNIPYHIGNPHRKPTLEERNIIPWENYFKPESR